MSSFSGLRLLYGLELNSGYSFEECVGFAAPRLSLSFLSTDGLRDISENCRLMELLLELDLLMVR